jgi:hypothetical protein
MKMWEKALKKLILFLRTGFLATYSLMSLTHKISAQEKVYGVGSAKT